jgi:adenine-specific DNA-methyltransferase
MEQYREKFQVLLRELFQFDCADLNFGIYRIMNHKRDVLDRFISNDLPKAVTDELDRGALAEQSHAAAELKEIAEHIGATLGVTALDADGNLADAYKETPLGKRYLDLKAKAAGSGGREALEANIFNHLYAFFSRYYRDGDFISKRRYSKRQKYAIPYNGEEVYLYWANNDQYYVKSAEHFRDYTFISHGVTVHFKLSAADVEQNNAGDGNRFFVSLPKKLDWNEKSSVLVIPFEYRPLTEKENISYGKKGQQDAIITNAVEEIPKRLKNADKALLALTAERREASDGRSVSFLEHHLRQYTRTNTSDFFIHKDLKGFLSRELDFYLKNEVLGLDELRAAGETRADAWFQIMRVLKSIGDRIIEFLAQLEDFQKMLWEKRKFVTEAQYCITVGIVDPGFYQDIATCEAQWAEWRELLHIDEEQTDLFSSRKNKTEKRVEFLNRHRTLMLDTKHFEAAFVDRLLASIGDMDAVTDGLLVHSENFQALNLIQDRYREQIKCVYIDPPYNTGNDEFIYKDNYQHSSWLTMITQAVSSVRALMSTASTFFASCDDNESYRFRECLNTLFGADNFESQIIVQSNKRGQTYKSIAKTHEYLLVYAADPETQLNGLPREIEDGESDDHGPFELWELRNRNPKFGRFNRPNLYFPVYVSPNQYEELGHSCVSTVSTGPFTVPVYPKNSVGEDSCWRWGAKKVEAASKAGDQILVAKRTRSGEWRIFEKSRKSIKAPKSIWFDIGMINEKGTTEVGSLGLSNFGFPKPLQLLETVCRIGSSETDTTIDFFAGTGTTAHALINLNREDEGERRFILVEMGDYFDTVLLPRIKKASFTPDWKDGKPERMATDEEADGSPRMVKYIRLESYEDSLNNIEFDDASGQRALRFDDYLLKYMLRWETRSSTTLLNAQHLSSPFRYSLNIYSEGQTKAVQVDLAETFNYLLGLRVAKRLVFRDGNRRYLVYRGQIDHRKITVIWRDSEGWSKADFERERKFVAENRITDGAEEVFVNGDSFISNAKALEPVFKARMFSRLEV